MADRGNQLPTFSVDYENQDRYFQPNDFQPDSDDAYIRLMAEQMNTRHYRTVLTPDELADALSDAVMARDLPGMADVDSSLLVFCGRIREKVKVALSGECADEIFGGYPWYRDPRILMQEGFPWAQNTEQRAALLHPKLNRYGVDFVTDAYQQTCRDSHILPGSSPQDRRMKEMVNLNFRWLQRNL